MKYTFKFMLKNGKSELHAFTASSVQSARIAALNFSQSSAFDIGEVIEFEWQP